MKTTKYGLLAAAALTFLPQVAFAADEVTDEAESTEIVVTGQKRNERVQDVPAAITALGADALQDRAVAKVEDLQRIAPGLTVTNSGLTQNVNIRGIGLASGNANASNGVSTYVDGMFQPPVVTTNGFYDISGVEVFRGPQGTFVGSNSTGGAVFINSRSPKLGSAEGYAQLTLGNYGRGGAEGALNLPLGNTLAVRGAFYVMNRNSYYRNNTGRVARPASLDELAGRIGLYWEPSDNFDALLKAEWGRKETEGYAWQPGPLTRYASFANADPYLLSYSDETRNSERNFQTTLRMNLTTSGGVVFRSLSGFTRKRIWNFYDQDATNTTTLPRSAQFQSVNEREITQEFNVLSPEGQAFKWVLGGYYQQNLIDVVNNNFSNGNNTTNILVKPDKRTKGIFAQVTVPLGEQLSIDIGGRHSWYSNISTGSVSLGNGTVVGNPGGNHHDKMMTGKVALNWKPDADNLVYAFVARGYKAGGIQAPTVSFRPETVIDYEIGWKSAFLDGALRTQIGAFYYDYTDFQLDSINPTTGLNAVFNIANATLKGVEGQFQYQSGGFQFDGGFAYVDSSLSAGTALVDTRAFALANPGVTNRPQCTAPGVPSPCVDYAPYLISTTSGPNLYSPKWSWNVSAAYEIEAGDIKVTPRVSYAYIGEQYAYIAYNPVRDRIPGYGLLSANVAFQIDNFELQLFASNVTKKVYISGRTAVNQFVGAPREFGVRLRADF